MTDSNPSSREVFSLIPELDYDAIPGMPPAYTRRVVDKAAEKLRAYAHDARERIEQLEGEVERLGEVNHGRCIRQEARLGKLLDEARIMLTSLRPDYKGPATLEMIDDMVAHIEQERQQPRPIRDLTDNRPAPGTSAAETELPGPRYEEDAR